MCSGHSVSKNEYIAGITGALLRGDISRANMGYVVSHCGWGVIVIIPQISYDLIDSANFAYFKKRITLILVAILNWLVKISFVLQYLTLEAKF